MNKSLRKAIIAGNWKMNKTRPEAKALLEAIKPLVANAEGKIEVIACVPFTNLETSINTTAGSNVKIGAENVHFEKKSLMPSSKEPYAVIALIKSCELSSVTKLSFGLP